MVTGAKPTPRTPTARTAAHSSAVAADVMAAMLCAGSEAGVGIEDANEFVFPNREALRLPARQFDGLNRAHRFQQPRHFLALGFQQIFGQFPLPAQSDQPDAHLDASGRRSR